MTVGVYADNFPYGFQRADGKLDGFSWELFQEVTKISNININVVVGTTRDIQEKFFAGELDMLLSFSFSEERAESIDFSASYLDMVGTVYARSDQKPINNISDLSGLRLLVHPGSLGEKALINAGLANSIVSVESVNDAFQKIERGEGDATLATRLTAESLIERDHFHAKAQPVPIPDYAVFYCFAVQKGNRTLLAKLNEGLAVLHRTGRYEPIYKKWFGRLEPRRFSAVEILIAVLVGLILALMVAIWAAVHQRRLGRKLTETNRALAYSEQKYREVFDSTPVALIVAKSPLENGPGSQTFVLQEANPAAGKLFGWAETPYALDLFNDHRDFAELWKLAQATQADTSPLNHSLEVERADLPRLHLDWKAVRRGNRVLVVVEDVTKEIQAAAELRATTHSLLQSQKLDALGTLTSGIAHDFNNILVGILGYADLLQLDHLDNPAVAEPTSHILAGARRAKSLIKQILTFSRAAPSQQETIDLHEIVLETLALVRAAAPKNIRIECDRDAAGIQVSADPSQIHQVAMNLCTNALQAIGDEIGVVHVKTQVRNLPAEKPRHSTVTLPPGAYACVAISDTGVGIAPDVLPRIFEPFFSTKIEKDGTGLGLSVVHGIVASHHGAISVESRLGRGSEFTLWLPLLDCPASSAVTEVPRPFGQVIHEPKELLIVDDEPDVLNLVARIVTRLGHRATTFTNATNAITAFDSAPDKFHALVCDLSMPGKSGLELTAEIRLRRPNIPVLLMSGFFTDAARREARALGVNVIAEKPLALQHLERALNTIGV